MAIQDTTYITKAVAYIARGILRKDNLLRENPNKYPNVPDLQHGINMFLAAAINIGKVDYEVLGKYGHEAAFLHHYCTKPVKEWFDDWADDVIDNLALEEQLFYTCDSLAERVCVGKGDLFQYLPTMDCMEYVDAMDSDFLGGIDQQELYKSLIALGSQELYCELRKFIIQHPVVDEDVLIEEKRSLADKGAQECLAFAYERYEGVAWKCPRCGWTLIKEPNGKLRCHSPYCTNHNLGNLPEFPDYDGRMTKFWRLKPGIMQFTATPGKLELEIAKVCDELGIQYHLWPQMDTYDIEIQFSDGGIWEIDAKAYRNPLNLKAKIDNEGGLKDGPFEKGYYVIPNEYTNGQKNYIKIINNKSVALQYQKKVKCVTARELKKQLKRRKEVATAHEQN